MLAHQRSQNSVFLPRKKKKKTNFFLSSLPAGFFTLRVYFRDDREEGWVSESVQKINEKFSSLNIPTIYQDFQPRQVFYFLVIITMIIRNLSSIEYFKPVFMASS